MRTKYFYDAIEHPDVRWAYLIALAFVAPVHFLLSECRFWMNDWKWLNEP